VQTVFLVLAVVGAFGLVHRLLRAVARLVLAVAEVTAASGMAEVSARRGDLTALAERRSSQRVARQRQWKDLLFVAGWLAWLIVPPLVGLAQPLYAAAAPLWFLPRAPVRAPAPPR
jgi:cobalamin synthase